MSEVLLRDSLIRVGTFFVARGLINGRTELDVLLSRVGEAMCGSKRVPNVHYGQGLVVFYKGAAEALRGNWNEAFWSFSGAAGHFEDAGAVVEYDVARGLRALAFLLTEQDDIAPPHVVPVDRGLGGVGRVLPLRGPRKAPIRPAGSPGPRPHAPPPGRLLEGLKGRSSALLPAQGRRIRDRRPLPAPATGSGRRGGRMKLEVE